MTDKPIAVPTIPTTEISSPPKPVVAVSTQPTLRTNGASFTITKAGRSDRWLKGMIYGNYGTGKTTLTASADDVESMRDVLYIDAEAGDMSLVDRPDLDRIGISSYAQMARIFEFLRIHCRLRDANDLDQLRQLEAKVRSVPVEQIKNPRRYRTVVIDSISELHKYCMYQLLGVRIGDRALDVEPDSPEFKEWGQASEMVRLMVRSFRDLPMHVLFVASETVVEDEKKRQLRRPNLPGKLGAEVQGFLDIVGYLIAFPNEQGSLTRRLYLQPGQTYQAKHRISQQFQVQFLESPSMQGLLNLTMQGSK